MNKWLAIPLSVVSLSLAGYVGYLFGAHSIPTLPDLLASDWQSLEPKITADCKQVKFAAQADRVDYDTNLFKATGGQVTYDAINDDFFSLPGRSAYILFLPPNSTQSCRIAWVGINKGAIGTLVYENQAGTIKTLRVKSFPSPF